MKNTKENKTTAPQFVIFDPPLPGFEARVEVRKVENGEAARHCRAIEEDNEGYESRIRELQAIVDRLNGEDRMKRFDLDAQAQKGGAQ